jgi:hypothetical protein
MSRPAAPRLREGSSEKVDAFQLFLRRLFEPSASRRNGVPNRCRETTQLAKAP